MLSLVLLVTLAQPSLRLAVLDVSAPDAIYEDVSRSLAEQVTESFLKKGFLAKRVDESEVPAAAEGCRIGPCLGIIAHAHSADVLVLLDATESAKGKVDVTLSAMRGRDGMPLAAGKWSTNAAGKRSKQLATFLEATHKAAAKHVARTE